MQFIQMTVSDPMGLHARPAGLLVKEAKKYQSKIFLHKGEKAVEATRLMAIMGLGIKSGEEFSVTIEGADEEAAAAALSAFFQENC